MHPHAVSVTGYSYTTSFPQSLRYTALKVSNLYSVLLRSFGSKKICQQINETRSILIKSNSKTSNNVSLSSLVDYSLSCLQIMLHYVYVHICSKLMQFSR